MAEQPWRDRTLDMPPQDPWAETPTAAGPTASSPGADAAHPTRVSGPADSAPTQVSGPTAAPGPGRARVPGPGEPEPPRAPFTRGVAHVDAHPRTRQFAAEHEPTGTGWPGADPPAPRRPLSWHLRELRRGGEWSSAAALFAFVGWGVWAISTPGPVTGPAIVFVLTLFVAAGVFGLARLLGRIVLERQLGRTRRTARGAHAVAAVFLAGVGFYYLSHTGWIVDAYDWVAGLFT